MPKRGVKNSFFSHFGKYLASMKIGFTSETIYPANYLSESILVVVRVAIMAALYRISLGYLDASEVGNLNVAEIVWILMITESVRYSVFSVARPIQDAIQNGDFAYQIARPYFYPLFLLTQSFGQSIPFLAVNLSVGIAACFFFVGPFHFSLLGLGLGLISLFFGYLLDSVIYLIIGLSAFWFENNWPLWWIYGRAKFILGGAMIPLAVFPPLLKKVAELLPFSQTYYSAALLIVKYDQASFGRFFLIQLFWISTFGLIATIMFRKGLKHVAANGG
ncbi:MAG: hypothetical protein NTW50_00585 [Candidatus Berkelbacteria bacterium]|nr:hypothetical protein [Candidatus Berkelbacteria bacterium]